MSQEELLDALEKLTSSKRRDRLDAFDNILALLKHDSIINILASKTGDNRISWTTVYLKVHNAGLAEVDKSDTGIVSAIAKQLSKVQSIIQHICQNSVHNELPLLDCDKVVYSIFSVFEMDFRIRCLGSLYTNFPLKYILNHRKFWGEIKPERWAELKDILKRSFKNPPPQIQNSVYLELLCDVIRISCKNSIISHHYLDLFSFIKDISVSHKNLLSKSGVPILRLINILCLQLATEFRYKVSSFMEDIFEFVLEFYEKKKNNKNPLIYHFLIIYLNVHNPNGVSETDESFYAFDKKKWREQVTNIITLTQEATKELIKGGKKTELEVGFMDLVVDLNNLIFICGYDKFENFNRYAEDDEFSEIVTPFNKRKRLSDSPQSSLLAGPSSAGRHKLIKRDYNLSSIADELETPDSWFWLQFLELLLQKYSQNVVRFSKLPKVLAEILHSCRESAVSQTVCRCLCIILSKERLFSRNISQIDAAYENEIWHKVGNELIRLLKVEESEDYHRLLRTLIVNSKFRDPAPLIDLYNKGALGENTESFFTLLTMCHNRLLPEPVSDIEVKDNIRCSRVRSFFIKWLFRGNAHYPIEEFSKILIALISTNADEESDVPKMKCTESLIASKNINDFCKLITGTYETISFKNIKFSDDVKGSENIVSPKIDDGLQSVLFNCLESRCNEFESKLLNEELSPNDKMKIISDSLHFCQLFFNLYSSFLKLGVNIQNWSALLFKLKTLLLLITGKSYQLLEKDINILQSFNFMSFFDLYSSNYHSELNNLIREKDCVNLEFLQHLFQLFQDGCTKYCNEAKEKEDELKTDGDRYSKPNLTFSNLISNKKSILHIITLGEGQKKIVEIVEVLCHFIINPSYSSANRFQKTLLEKLLDKLMEDDFLDFNSNFHLQIGLRVAYNFSKCLDMDSDNVNKNLKLLSSIFKFVKYDCEVAVIILEIMKEFLNTLNQTRNEICEADFILLIDEFRDRIGDKYYGTSVMMKCLDFLSALIKIEWSETSKFHFTTDDSFKCHEEIIQYLKHPYYEVRLFAAKKIGAMFPESPSNEDRIEQQKKLISSLVDCLKDDEDLPQENEDTLLVLPYYKNVGISVDVISWTSIICRNCYWRKLALFHLFEFAHIKKFSQWQTMKSITLICDELKLRNEKKFIEAHLPYLMNKWMEARYEIEAFPTYLLEIRLLDFLRTYANVIVPICLWNGNSMVAIKISRDLNKALKEIMQDCLPELLAIVLPLSTERSDCESLRRVGRLKQFIENEMGAISPKTIFKYLERLLFKIFDNIEDKDYLSNLLEDKMFIIYNTNLLKFTVIRVQETLEKLAEEEGGNYLGLVLIERPCVIQRVLLLMMRNVENACKGNDKVIAVHKYAIFVDMLTSTTRESVYRNFVMFVIRDVIYTLVFFIRSCKCDKITTIALKILKLLLTNYMTEFSDIIGDFLYTVTIICRPFALKGYKEAKEILKFLIIDNFSKLQPVIFTLDYFPPESVFEELNKVLEKNRCRRTTLEDCITHFLNFSGKHSVEGLKCLRNALTTKKENLKIMQDDLNELNGFSEDCGRSLLHQLICSLVEQTASENINVKMEAAKCLGELGPLDLTTLVLRPRNRYTKETPNQSPTFRLLKSCWTGLSDLIISDNIYVKIAATEMTYIILFSDSGKILFKEEDEKTKKFLVPFCTVDQKPLTIRNNANELISNLNHSHLWIPKNHEEWIKTLVIHILRSCSDTGGLTITMLKMVLVNWQFAERIFPFLLDLILLFRDPARNDVCNRNFGQFLREYVGQCDKTSTSPLNLRSLQCMVNAIDYIRIQRNYEGIYEGFELKMNYLHVAEAARLCSAFYTSILYVELWYNEKIRYLEDEIDLTMGSICELYPDECKILTRILRDCYSKIGIFDGVDGCGYEHLLDFTKRSQHYERLNKMNISALCHDVGLSQGTSHTEVDLINSLQQCGMLYSASKLIESSSNKKELSDAQYKCATALSNWSVCDNNLWMSNAKESYEKSRYFALKAFHREDELSFQNEIRKARKRTIAKLSLCSLESAENLYQFLGEFRCIKELEDFGSVSKSSNLSDIEKLLNSWRLQDNIRYRNFKLVEEILSQRIVMLREEYNRNKNPEIKNVLHLMISQMYYKLMKTARKEKRYETAIRYLNCINRLENVPDFILGKVKIENSLLEWEIGDVEVGKYMLCHYLKKDEIIYNLKVKALRIYGDWAASTKSENARHIIEQYYYKSIEMSKDAKDKMNSFASLAKFADSNYEQVKEYLSSPLFEVKKNNISSQQSMVTGLLQEMGENQDRERRFACRLAERQSLIDESEIKNSEREKDWFLGLAVKYYLLSLKVGEKYDLLVFRLISLWFSNLDDANVINKLKEYLNDIPSYKFLCLLPQIVPRMAETGLISSLVERALQDHPHHTLPLLFALANSFEDSRYGGAAPASYPQRARVARLTLEKFEKDERLKHYITEMGRFCEAMIEFANFNPGLAETSRKDSVKIPAELKISNLKNLSYVAVPSLTIPYEKTCNYDVTGIKSFEESYQFVGGINLPKKITCIGLDGSRRSLLIKGKDDLRQDAVMQQVFTIMNSLLHRNPDTSRRKLVIRTYKVVPLSHRSGIIEWCENTQPLSLYLIGPDSDSGAHKRLNPRDLTALECRSMIRQAFSVEGATNDLKLQVFTDVCRRFKPIFRYYFFENFAEPAVWFERRLAYTHSVATSSMIGYILGIGDRHVNNILIDNSTAEVIHIDLGIAFEQGKILPIPETVPFRLTRDIVDGMGITGVEGIFKSSCIYTMKVLRENVHTILTLLEVLLYDPLYAWTITAEKALTVQGREGTESSSEKDSSDVEINKMAERALIRLKQKLQGLETGGVATNAEGQVNCLIQQAKDPNNLCRLFHGWQAYL